MPRPSQVLATSLPGRRFIYGLCGNGCLSKTKRLTNRHPKYFHIRVCSRCYKLLTGGPSRPKPAICPTCPEGSKPKQLTHYDELIQHSICRPCAARRMGVTRKQTRGMCESCQCGPKNIHLHRRLHMWICPQCRARLNKKPRRKSTKHRSCGKCGKRSLYVLYKIKGVEGRFCQTCQRKSNRWVRSKVNCFRCGKVRRCDYKDAEFEVLICRACKKKSKQAHGIRVA